MMGSRIAPGMADILEVVVRYAHIVSAILWIGGLGFSVMVLRSVMSRVGMPARKDVMRQLIPVSGRFIPMTGVSTIIFGAFLYLLMGSFDANVLLGTTWGLILFASLVLAVGLLAFGIIVVRGSSERILVHLNEESCGHGAEVGALQRRLNLGQMIALVWGFFILAFMIVATGAL